MHGSFTYTDDDGDHTRTLCGADGDAVSADGNDRSKADCPSCVRALQHEVLLRRQTDQVLYSVLLRLRYMTSRGGSPFERIYSAKAIAGDMKVELAITVPFEED